MSMELQPLIQMPLIRHTHMVTDTLHTPSPLRLFLLYFLLFSYYSYHMNIEHFDRITQDPAIMGGKPCIRGMRVTVGMIVGQIGEGVTIEELLSDYPYIEKEDILQTLRYAAALSQWREVALAEA